MDKTVSDLIEALGGNIHVARIIGRGPSAVSEMKRSGRIDARYWQILIAAARAAGPGLDWITSDALVAMHARPSDAAMSSQAVAP